VGCAIADLTWQVGRRGRRPQVWGPAPPSAAPQCRQRPLPYGRSTAGGAGKIGERNDGNVRFGSSMFGWSRCVSARTGTWNAKTVLAATPVGTGRDEKPVNCVV